MNGGSILVPVVGHKVHDVVRIDGMPHRVDFLNADNSRSYTRISDGQKFNLTYRQQREFASKCRITTNDQWESLGPELHHALNIDWRLFTEEQRAKADWRNIYHLRLDMHGPKERRKKSVIQQVIDEVAAEDNSGRAPPSVRQMREFDKRWIYSGRNPKALVDLDHNKGNRRRHDDAAWIDQFLNEAIDKGIKEGWTIAQVEVDADARLALMIEQNPELPLRPRLTDHRVFGKNRVRELLARRNFYEQNLNTLGRKEVRRLSAGVTVGPQGELALAEVEVDHTMMDVFINWDGKPRRAWLTAIIDRHSRLILGFYITIEPPSWFSVLMALRMAVLPKEEFLRSLNYEFEYIWDCFGTPDTIYVDRGPEFRSATLATSCRLLQIQILDLPRASGQLKGKIERWLGTQGRAHLKKLPGYTGANPKERIQERVKGIKLELHALQRLTAIYIVDVYNARPHSGIGGEVPYKRYERSIAKGSLKLPPPRDLLGVATNPARTAVLTEAGIRIDGMQYRSDELRQMWFDAGGNVQVLVLTDIDHGNQILVHHGSDRTWVPGKLTGKHANSGLDRRTLLQLVKSEKPVESAEEVKKRRQALVKANDEIRLVAPARKPGTPITKPPSKRTTHISRPIFDPKASVEALRGHDPTRPVQLNRYDGNGPFAEPSLAEMHAAGARMPTTATPPPRPPALETYASTDPADEASQMLPMGTPLLPSAEEAPQSNHDRGIPDHSDDDDDLDFGEVIQF